MVDQDGQLRLVDFDGVRIPQLAGQAPPTEFGHPNYQHPVRHVWDRWLDTFSALVIYLSLVALGKDPGLWLALYNSKNLLFAKNDFFPPFKTEVWKQLAALRDPQVDELARRLRECCDPDWVSDRSLEMTLDQPAAAPALPQVPAEQRWWEQKPASGQGPGAVVVPAPAQAPASPRPRRLRPRRPAPVAPSSAAAPPGRPVPRCPPRRRCPRRSAWRAPDRCRSCSQTDGAARRHHLVVAAAGSARPRVRPDPDTRGYHGSVPAAPMPRGYAPRAPVPTAAPGPPAPATARPGPAAKPQPGPVVGAIALGLGDRAADHRRGQPHLHRRDRRPGRPAPGAYGGSSPRPGRAANRPARPEAPATARPSSSASSTPAGRRRWSRP